MVLVSVGASNDNLPMLGKLFHFRETIILVWRGKKEMDVYLNRNECTYT